MRTSYHVTVFFLIIFFSFSYQKATNCNDNSESNLVLDYEDEENTLEKEECVDRTVCKLNCGEMVKDCKKNVFFNLYHFMKNGKDERKVFNHVCVSNLTYF